MDNLAVASLRKQEEPLASLSILHLTPASRQMLVTGTLSVHAYPNDYGGFVHVGVRGDTVPDEPELEAIFDIARRAGLVWLKFDADAVVIDGLPVFDDFT